MSSAISFATVLIHLELMPRGEFISSEQKKRASLRPMFDFLHAPVVHLRADILSVTLRRTGWGSTVTLSCVIVWREAM